MPADLKIKFLFGVMLAAAPAYGELQPARLPAASGSPAEVRTAASAQQAAQDQGSLRVPVEVVAKDGESEWVIVEVEPQAIPEPSAAVLLLLVGGALLLRRDRKA